MKDVAIEQILTNFVVIIGAQRSGSTLLYELLDRHPQISMVKPLHPEPKVFLREALTKQDLRTWVGGKVDCLDPTALVFGEKSTSYIERPDAANTIGRLLPSARIIATLRNPIDRAVSNFRFSTDNGFETKPIETALRRELNGDTPVGVAGVSTSPFAYLERGQYLKHLRPWIELFGPHNLRIVLLEELAAEPTAIIDLYRWLGVASNFAPRINRQINATPGQTPALDPDLSDQLREHFHNPNAELADVLDLDLSSWT